MYSSLSKNIEKIFSEFYKLNKSTKNTIKYGTQLGLLVLLLGAGLIFFNHSGFHYDAYFEFIATSVVKASFTILAIVIIGSLLIDYVFNKSQ